MKTRTVTVLAALTLVLSSAGAAVASAGTLLSGYGGPGQGNQAILGSGLLNSPPGGGQGGGSGGSSTGAGAATSNGSAGGTGTVSTGARHGSTAAPGASGSHARGSATRSAPAGGASAGGAAQTASVSVPTLGLSGADLLYILLTVAALAMTAVLTRQLTGARAEGASAKGMTGITRVTK
jgi:hypothetical protein